MSKLNFLVKACVEEYLWSPENAAKFVAEFERFMVIKRVKQDWNDTLITPAPIIDQVWRVAILHTAEYPAICGKQMIHYSLMLENDSKRYNETLETYEGLFGEPANELIWPRTIVWDSDNEMPPLQQQQHSAASPTVKKKRRSSLSSRSGSRKRPTAKKQPILEKLQPAMISTDPTQPVNSAEIVQSLLYLDPKSRSLGGFSVDSSATVTSNDPKPISPPAEPSALQCLQCGKYFETADELGPHNRDEHQLFFSLNFPDGVVAFWRKNSNQPCACPRCQTRFKTGNLLQIHCRTAKCYLRE